LHAVIICPGIQRATAQFRAVTPSE
jgi:hypothetical protein